MEALVVDAGSCPACGDLVPRVLSNANGRMRETYTCPVHGAFAYGPQSVSVGEWIRRATPKDAGAPSARGWADALGVPYIPGR